MAGSHRKVTSFRYGLREARACLSALVPTSREKRGNKSFKRDVLACCSPSKEFQDMATRISCLCGLTKQEVALNFLSRTSLCHCRPCRATSGMLCTSYFALCPPQASFTSNLVRYSEAPGISRWFCGTCGAHVFLQFESAQHKRLLVAAGLVARDLAPRTNHIDHRCVSSARDGGIFRFLRASSARESLPVCYTGNQESTSYGQDRKFDGHASDPEPISTADRELETELDSRLFASCHCAGVRYYITRPDDSSRSPSSPWPDLLIPYHLESHSNPANVKWWLCEEKPNGGRTTNDRRHQHYLAGLCACNSCRLASGFPIQAWAFVPRTNILKVDGSPLSYDIPTMRRYESSPGVYREFCRVCGATVFWHCAERPGVVDVSVGLLQAKTGVRAKGWLQWATSRVSFSEEAPDQGLVRALQEGLKAFSDL